MITHYPLRLYPARTETKYNDMVPLLCARYWLHSYLVHPYLVEAQRVPWDTSTRPTKPGSASRHLQKRNIASTVLTPQQQVQRAVACRELCVARNGVRHRHSHWLMRMHLATRRYYVISRTPRHSKNNCTRFHVIAVSWACTREYVSYCGVKVLCALCAYEPGSQRRIK